MNKSGASIKVSFFLKKKNNYIKTFRKEILVVKDSLKKFEKHRKMLRLFFPHQPNRYLTSFQTKMQVIRYPENI